MDLVLGNLLKCPAGTPGTAEKTFEMQDIYRLEARKEEVGHVNKTTAAGLMQAFEAGYSLTSQAYTLLKWELTQAEKYADERKAVVYLEVAPAYLQEKGLVRAANPSGSEDQRRAVLALDKEYQGLAERVAMIEAAAEFMHLKMKGFEMSYQSVKKVYDNLTSTNTLNFGANKPAFKASEFSDGPIAVGKPRY